MIVTRSKRYHTVRIEDPVARRSLHRFLVISSLLTGTRERARAVLIINKYVMCSTCVLNVFVETINH